MVLLIEWGTTLHNRMILCLLVAYITYRVNKTAPHWRVHDSLQPNFPWLAQADSVIGA